MRKTTEQKIGTAIGYGIIVMMFIVLVGVFIKYVIMGWLLK